MNFEAAPKREQGPDLKRVKEFVVPITEFVEGKPEVIEILRTNIRRDSNGRARKEEQAALRSAIAEVRGNLRKRFEPTVVESPNSQKGLNEKIERLEKIEELAFAA